jgi:hypothetical protein
MTIDIESPYKLNFRLPMRFHKLTFSTFVFITCILIGDNTLCNRAEMTKVFVKSVHKDRSNRLQSIQQLIHKSLGESLVNRIYINWHQHCMVFYFGSSLHKVLYLACF